MGQDKAFLSIGGRLLVQRVLDALGEISTDLIIVANTLEPYTRFGVRLVGDAYPGTGTLGGIFTAIQAARHPYTYVVACDMPFLNVALLRYMAVLAPGHDVVIPRLAIKRRPLPGGAKETARDRELHPLHAIYSKDCLSPIERALAKGDLRAIVFLPDVRVAYLVQEEIDVFDPAHMSFFNVNAPEDLAQAEAMCRDE